MYIKFPKVIDKGRQFNLQMIPEKRLYVLGIRTCGLTSKRTPFSVLTYSARNFPALFSVLSKIISIAWNVIIKTHVNQIIKTYYYTQADRSNIVKMVI